MSPPVSASFLCAASAVPITTAAPAAVTHDDDAPVRAALAAPATHARVPRPRPHPPICTEAQRAERLASYLSSRGSMNGAVISFEAARLSVSTGLAPSELLQAVLDLSVPTQVAKLNHPGFARPDAFPLLLAFLRRSGVWACNLGEIEFSEEQCKQLCKALEAGGVGFLFVDKVKVGGVAVRRLKDTIWSNRDRRRRNESEPWLLSAVNGAAAQNAVIRSARGARMWRGPLLVRLPSDRARVGRGGRGWGAVMAEQ